MLGFLTTVIPTIGKIAGALLNKLNADGAEEPQYVAYDLDPENTGEVATCQAVFTKQNDQIILSNAGIDRTRAIRMHFLESPSDENDDVVVRSQKECLVNDIFKRHAELDDGRFELSPMDTRTQDGGQLRHRTRRHDVPVDGTTVPFGSFFTVALQGQELTFTLESSYTGTIYAVDYVTVSTSEDVSGQSFRLENQVNPASSGTITMTLPAPFSDKIARVLIEACIIVQSNANGDLLEKMEERCRPISARTLEILEKGRRLNGDFGKENEIC